MDNEPKPEKDSKPEDKMAEQFARYGDLIVAFVVLQSLSFGYALGQSNDVQEAIVRGWSIIIWFILGAGVFYGGLIWFCASWEESLRCGAHHSPTVLSASRAAAYGRVAIVIVASFIAACGLYLNKPSSTHHQRRAVEYKQVFHSGKAKGPIEPVLNELAKDGWRVVGYQGFPEQEVWVLLERKK